MKRVMLALAFALFSAAPAVGQTELAFSGGVGLAAGFPVGDFAEGREVETGFGFTLSGRLHFTPVAAVYGEYARFRFGADVEEEDLDANIADNGFALGAEVWIPTAGSFTPVLRAGGIYNRAELAVGDGSSELNFESDRSLGFEVGAGLALAMSPALEIVPTVRYRAFSPEFEIFGETGGGDMTYATAGISLIYRFGS